jgi:hypothetical protein
MNLQPMKNGSTLRRIAVFSGGTVIHVRPHFSLCAPAYGNIGTLLEDKLRAADRLINLLPPRDNIFFVDSYRTKMAGGLQIETNEDLANAVNTVLDDKDVSVIVMAAAICDFEPAYIASNSSFSGCSSRFGKDQQRLSSDRGMYLHIRPAQKIIDQIKKKRPDVLLVTFKTTSDQDQDILIRRSKSNMIKSQSDIVLGNDIKNHFNVLVSRKETKVFEDRVECVEQLALDIITHPYKSD